MNALEKVNQQLKALKALTFFIRMGVITKHEADKALQNGITTEFVFTIQQRLESRLGTDLKTELSELLLYLKIVDSLKKLETLN